MKRERHCRNNNIELYKKLDDSCDIENIRYWGLYPYGDRTRKPWGQVKIDIKRFKKQTRTCFSEEQLKIINKRKTHYFYPKKYYYYDYNCNILISAINEIRLYWNEQFLPLIKIALDKVKKPEKVDLIDYNNFTCGISGPNSAQAWANIQNWKRNNVYYEKCTTLLFSLYAEFFHFMSSRIEAILVKVLNINNFIADKFDRNQLYATSVGKQKSVKDLPHFAFFDRLYCIWNFIKHNSLSTYKTLNERYPEVMYKNKKYEQGDPALYFINFTDELILESINGCGEFFKEYCSLIFDENYSEAQWNYTLYFTNIVKNEIETITNPLGLGPWDDLD